MKAKNTKKRQTVRICPAYPNAADKAYYIQKVIDIATAVVSVSGVTAAFVFMLAVL